MRHMRAVGWLLVCTQFLGLTIFILVPWRTTSLFMVCIGATILALGFVVIVTSFAKLGDALTPTPVPKSSRSLRTTGIYAYVRHPIYVGIMLCMAGWIIALGSWWTGLVGTFMVVFFVAKSRWEDRLLAKEYGAKWQEWHDRVGAFLPHLSR